MIATLYAGLGNKDKAFEYLEKAYQERCWDIAWCLKAALRTDSLRCDPHFQSLLQRVEDNWELGRIGNDSADAIAVSLDGLFDFSSQGRGDLGHDDHANAGQLILDPATGQIVK
jgi:hypothetical protein